MDRKRIYLILYCSPRLASQARLVRRPSIVFRHLIIPRGQDASFGTTLQTLTVSFSESEPRSAVAVNLPAFGIPGNPFVNDRSLKSSGSLAAAGACRLTTADLGNRDLIGILHVHSVLTLKIIL